jgi:uncharacterized protein (TIGR00730 family)
MNICVFCGSSTGLNPSYADAARTLGSLMGKQKIRLIYGGGNVGLMGIVADSVLASQGEVIGVIPDFLMKREVGHTSITRLEVVESMHLRKKRMAALADAFIALPGGWGTMEELCEVLTWRQLGLIQQPVAILNVNNFFDPLLEQLRKMIQEGYVKPEYLTVLQIETSPEKLLASLSTLSEK